MTADLPEDTTVWGRPPAEPKPWGLRETVMAVGIAAVIAGLGGAAVYAATGSSSSQFMGPPGLHSAGPGDGPPPGAMGLGSASHGGQHGPPVHGEVVAADGSGGFITVMSQSGTITSTTPDSITVRSEDGFIQTWATSVGQGSRFAIDDSVMVQGEQAGTATAPTVTEVLDPLRTPLPAAPGGL